MEKDAVGVPECSICLQPYDDSVVVPRVLSCGHSLCDCCISSLANADEQDDQGGRRPTLLRCPECNQRSKLHGLPKNIELLRFIGGPDFERTLTHASASSARPRPYWGRGPSFVYESSIAEVCRWIIPQRSAEIDHHTTGLVFLCRGEDSSESTYPATFICIQGAWEEGKRGLGLDYRQLVRMRLERLAGHEVKDLLHLLRAQEGVFGIWMHAKDGCLYLVYRTLAVYNQLGKALLDIGTSSLSHFCIKRGIELCEIFMGLHTVHVLAGLLTPSCLGSSDFMHLRLDVGALLCARTSFSLLKSNKPAALVAVTTNDSSQSSDAFPFFYSSPEFLLLLQNSDKCEISCKTDSWTFACLFCNIFLGETPWDGLTLEKFQEISVHGMQHAHSWMKNHVDADTLGTKAPTAEVVKSIVRCFSYSPAERPCISEVWHLLNSTETLSSSSKGSSVCCNAGAGTSANVWCLILGCNIHPAQKHMTEEKQDSSASVAECPCLESSEQCCRTIEYCGSELQKSGSLEGHLGDVTCLAVFGHHLLSASLDKTIRVWSLKDFSLIKSYGGHTQKVMALACSQHSSIFVSGDYGGELLAWDVESSEASFVNKWHHHRDWRYSGVASLAISTESLLYSGAGDKTIKVWSLQDFNLVTTLEGHKALVSALLIDGEILFSGSWDGTVRLWWRSDHCPLAVLNESTELGGVLSITSSTELLLVGYQSGRIQVWKDEVCMNTILAHENTISSLCVSGDRVYSGSWDGNLKAWNIDSLLDNAVSSTIVACGAAIKAVVCFDNKLFLGLSSKTIIVYITN
ncbi:hypothetical protein GOP47_0005361 [Adiantum capillus-veneris]|uniref:RING-type domain-containing protein n=1 Tax=Adiantum capillus-veneris TaxID=13818 RepID=A0A9D4ZN60_ADICA|nr:hypothetical protein GOP47_0005361 [Adiantum capillus-veneris]